MNVLFVHNNFPAQYRHIAQELAASPENQVVAIGSSSARAPANIRLLKYSDPALQAGSPVHPFARRFDLECRRAEEVLYSLSALASKGFKPDLIFAHPGWGETLPLRSIFPKSRIVLYCEFFYGAEGKDVGFDPEFPAVGLDGNVALHLKNASSLLALTECDLGISPTAWQKSTFPGEYHHKIQVVHEGVDTDEAVANPQAELRLPNGARLKADDEVVTFVSRNLEPLRGFHIFMRSLPKILRERPNAHVVVVGGDGTSYGAHPPAGSTWKSLFLSEVQGAIDLDRVHFLGNVPRQRYLQVLQISSAHVYLTYPFVLSWSLLEAMSVGCLVIASDTPPLWDAVTAERGFLVPFFDVDALSDRVIHVLSRPSAHQAKRKKARQHILKHFDAKRVCLPAMMKLLG